MASWLSPSTGNRLFKLLTLIMIAISFPCVAQKPPASGLPNLPAVEDEAAYPSGKAPAASAPATGGRFASVDEARDKLREIFSTRDYSAVLGLAAEIRRQYPTETFVSYYETTAQIQLKESRSDNSKLPYRRLESYLPTGNKKKSAATAKATVGAKSKAELALPVTAVSTPAARRTPAPTPIQAKPPLPIPAPTTPKTTALDQALEYYQENQTICYVALGAIIILGVLAVALLRRRGKHEEEDEEEKEEMEIPGAPVEAMSGGMSMESKAEAPRAPAGFKPAYRSEMQALGRAGGIKPEPVIFKASQAEIIPERPSPEPIFALMTDEEHEIALAPREEPRIPTPEADRDLLRVDEISFDENAFDSADEPVKPVAALPPAGLPVFDPDNVAESLVIEEPLIFELSAAPESPRPAPPPDPIPEVFKFDTEQSSPGVEAPAPQAEIHEAVNLRIDDLLQVVKEPENGVESSVEEIELAGEETLAALPEEIPQENPAGTMDDTTGAIKPEKVEPEEFQAFHSGETVTVNISEEAKVEETQISAEPPLAAKEAKKVDALDSSDDVFEREYKQGIKDTEAFNWVGAIHHLSIAAALRPGAMEVKERLREARRMRAKELEGRG